MFQEKAPFRSSVYRWCKQLQRGVFSISDDSRPGRPAETVSLENIATVKKLIEVDTHITYKQVEETLKIKY